MLLSVLALGFAPGLVYLGDSPSSSEEVRRVWLAAADDALDPVNCTGTAQQPAPVCYAGDTGFGAEHLETHIKIFDAASNAGVLDMLATGMVPMTCTDKKFTKSGQLIAVNVSDCVDPQVTVGDIKYCSDQDVSLLTMSYAGIPLTATLAREACP